MKRHYRETSSEWCSPWFILGLFCYYIPFWGGSFWFYSRLDVDAVRVTTFFDWVVALTILFVWMGLGLGGIIVAAIVGEVLRMVFGEEYLKRHLQRDEGKQHWDARLDASWSMLDSGHELLGVRSADSTVVQDGFEKPAPPVIPTRCATRLTGERSDLICLWGRTVLS